MEKGIGESTLYRQIQGGRNNWEYVVRWLRMGYGRSVNAIVQFSPIQPPSIATTNSKKHCLTAWFFPRLLPTSPWDYKFGFSYVRLDLYVQKLLYVLGNLYSMSMRWSSQMYFPIVYSVRSMVMNWTLNFTIWVWFCNTYDLCTQEIRVEIPNSWSSLVLPITFY